MKIRKHKNNLWFRIAYHFELAVVTGHRWTGSKLVPKSIEIKPTNRLVVYRRGSSANAVLRAFRRYQDTTIRATCRPATEQEIADHKLPLR